MCDDLETGLVCRKGGTGSPHRSAGTREVTCHRGETMSAYRLYWVMNGKIKPGKYEEAAKWWRERGAPDMLSEPWTVSLHVYAGQFGLSGDHDIEVWQEIKDYAAFDRIDKWWFEDDPTGAKKKQDLWRESNEYFEWGPARLMGDWPESGLLPE